MAQITSLRLKEDDNLQDIDHAQMDAKQFLDLDMVDEGVSINRLSTINFQTKSQIQWSYINICGHNWDIVPK